ncbi:MAG TPA: pyridoxal phosphate-dependent aminotransferase [Patescibacteria group bacterium]|jgi:aspartate aminotransferase|nr:pyridoxal phosphate-dependent aminotransferase [Patescibacteria group bacterium]
MVTVSKRLLNVPASPIRKLVPFAMAAKKAGVHVYHLNIGDPDIKTPGVMMDVLKNWNIDPIGYSQSQGQPEFLEALKIYYNRLGYGFIDIPNIQVTSGGSEAISMALFAISEPDDEVIVFEPFYANYNTYAVVNGVKLVPVRTSIENGFHLPEKSVIEKHISKRTKAILICSPNNPTGTVFTKAEMDMLVGLAKKHGLFMLVDEVYREYTYDGRMQTSLLSYMQEIPDQAIMLDSMSKRYNLCGVRLGVLVSLNADVMAGVLRIGQGRLSSGIVDQMIAAKLTEVPESWLHQTHEEWAKRRDVLYEGLKKIPGVTIPKPEGAFYSIVGLPISDSEDFAKWLLTDFRDNNETVMVAPAAGFYATRGLGKNEVRIAYVLNTKALKRSVELLSKALTEYNK